MRTLKHRIVSRIIPTASRFIGMRLPSVIAIEATNRCFLECLTCPIPAHMTRPKGDMSLATFGLLLQQITWKISKMSWAFGGEPLMNPALWDMIRMAADRGIPSKVDTNGMLLERSIDKVFSSGLRVLNVAFEGLSKDSTAHFRKGYDFEKVVQNLIRITDEKKKRKAVLPEITLNYLVRKDNENDIEKTVALAKTWGVNAVTLKSINITPSDWLSTERMQDLGDKYLPVHHAEMNRYTHTHKGWQAKQELSDYCRYLLNSITVTWDGKILPCCLDYDATIVAGDIHQHELKAIWRGARFRTIRKQVYTHKLALCNNCTSVSLQRTINPAKVLT